VQGPAELAARRGQRDAARGYLERAAALFERHGARLYLRQVEGSRASL
jgi:hypothetical protein